VRIAISAAIGLSMALKAELVGLVSAAALEVSEAEYAMIGDARRGAFYYAEVRAGECVAGPLLLNAEALSAKLAESALPVFTDAPIEAFPQADLSFPSASRLARLAAEDRGIIQRKILEPLYLRDPHITPPKAK
jgi:tRNA A37 threonylcarbamoyladenosine modification protein TsaB